MFDKREPAEFELAPDLAAIERQLLRLTPAAPRIDRDRLMFEAGRAAARSGRPGYIAGPFRAGSRFWPAATAAMAAATLLLAAMLVWQRGAMLDVGREAKPPLGRELGAERQAALARVDDRPGGGATRLAPRPELFTASWPAFQQPANGYLGVRYIALTRGVGALEPSESSTTGGRDSSDGTPRTQRDMLNELLPSSQRAINPRS